MHLLRVDQSGDLYQDGEAVDLGLSPARFVILSAADTDLMLLASAVDQSGRGDDAVRLANILTLSHPYSIDLLVDQTLRASRLMVVRLLGGISYWSYGRHQICEGQPCTVQLQRSEHTDETGFSGTHIDAQGWR